MIVRLPNWVGDVVMALPAIERLERAGFTPWLVGRRWAGSLLAGHGWRLQPLEPGSRARIDRLRQWRDEARAVDDRFGQRLNTLLLPNSLSSAWDAWRAGLAAAGYRRDGRGLLLRAPIDVPPTVVHESERFDHLAAALLQRVGSGLPGADDRDRQPSLPRLRLGGPELERAEARLAQAVGSTPFACIVPFATGTLQGRSKTWPAFAAFSARLAERLPVVVVPGPAEVAVARTTFPAAACLEDVDLGTYAAVLAKAAVVIANDTGPAHLAAAVGARLVSVLGPTDARRHRPLGPRVMIVQAEPWPTIEAVEAALDAALADET